MARWVSLAQPADVLQAGDLELARRIRDHCGEQAWWRPQAIAFRFDLLENPERFEPLERDCRSAVCPFSDEDLDLDEPLTLDPAVQLA